MRPIVYTAMTLALAMSVSSAAHANPRFQVQNDTKKAIKVFIYNGSDTSCTTKLKDMKVEPGEKRGAGCDNGGDKNQCKVQIKDEFTREILCEANQNTCDKDAIKMPRGKTLVVVYSSDNSCSIQ